MSDSQRQSLEAELSQRSFELPESRAGSLFGSQSVVIEADRTAADALDGLVENRVPSEGAFDFLADFADAAEKREQEAIARDADRYMRTREQVVEEYGRRLTSEMMAGVIPDFDIRVRQFEEELDDARQRLDVDYHRVVQSDYTDFWTDAYRSASEAIALLQPQQPQPEPEPEPQRDPLAVIAEQAGVPTGTPPPVPLPAPPPAPLPAPARPTPSRQLTPAQQRARDVAQQARVARLAAPGIMGGPGGGPGGLVVPPGAPPGAPPPAIAMAAQLPVASVSRQLRRLPRGEPYDSWRRRITSSDTLRDLIGAGLLTMDDIAAHEHAPGFNGRLTDGTVVAGWGGPRGGLKYLDEMENQAQGMPEPEISERQYNARRFRTVDVQDLFEDSRRAPVPRLAPGYTVYRRPRMAEEGVPENAEAV